MDRMKRAVIVTELADRLRSAGSWCGETHMQKAVYFLQELLKVPMGYNFILYKHGPFSFDLRHELAELRADRLLQLRAFPPYGPSLLSTHAAEQLKNGFPQTLRRYNEQIDFVSNHLGKKGVAELERLATALYVTRNAGLRSSEDRAKHIHKLKPHVRLDLALDAVSQTDGFAEKAECLTAAI